MVAVHLILFKRPRFHSFPFFWEHSHHLRGSEHHQPSLPPSCEQLSEVSKFFEMNEFPGLSSWFHSHGGYPLFVNHIELRLVKDGRSMGLVGGRHVREKMPPVSTQTKSLNWVKAAIPVCASCCYQNRVVASERGIFLTVSIELQVVGCVSCLKSSTDEQFRLEEVESEITRNESGAKVALLVCRSTFNYNPELIPNLGAEQICVC